MLEERKTMDELLAAMVTCIARELGADGVTVVCVRACTFTRALVCICSVTLCVQETQRKSALSPIGTVLLVRMCDPQPLSESRSMRMPTMYVCACVVDFRVDAGGTGMERGWRDFLLVKRSIETTGYRRRFCVYVTCSTVQSQEVLQRMRNNVR